MAIRIATAYANATAPDTNYPGGSFKNKSTPAATDGTPLEKQWANDLYGFGEALLAAAGIAHSDAPDTAVASDRLNALMVLMRKFGAPAGAVEFFALSAAPSGWLVANGQAVSRTTYAELFAAIGTTYGVGDGSTTFNVPDLRGYFLRALDNGANVDIDGSARVIGSAPQADQLKSHTHTVPRSDINGNSGNNAWGTGAGINVATAATGGTETRPKNIALLACIKW